MMCQHTYASSIAHTCLVHRKYKIYKHRHYLLCICMSGIQHSKMPVDGLQCMNLSVYVEALVLMDRSLVTGEHLTKLCQGVRGVSHELNASCRHTDPQVRTELR